MDDFVVRLGRAPDPAVGEAPFKPSRQSCKFPVKLVVLAVLLMLVALNRSTVEGWVQSALDTAKKPVRALGADGEMRKAEEVLVRQWNREGTYDVPVERLASLDESIGWNSVIRYRSCFGGLAAVISADTATGAQSQLVVRGANHGIVGGDVGCPRSPSDLSPWGDLAR